MSIGRGEHPFSEKEMGMAHQSNNPTADNIKKVKEEEATKNFNWLEKVKNGFWKKKIQPPTINEFTNPTERTEGTKNPENNDINQAA